MYIINHLALLSAKYLGMYKHTTILFLNVNKCTYRHLGSMYPHSPTMKEFCHTMLSHPDFGNAPERPLYILSQLALNMSRLEAIGELLPDLIRFYNWLHTEGVYKVERAYAFHNGMEHFITKMDNKFPDLGIFKLYERVRGNLDIAYATVCSSGTILLHLQYYDVL